MVTVKNAGGHHTILITLNTWGLILNFSFLCGARLAELTDHL